MAVAVDKSDRCHATRQVGLKISTCSACWGEDFENLLTPTSMIVSKVRELSLRH